VNCRGAIASGHLRIDLLQSIHAVVDNYATPKHRKVRWRLAQHPRWTFHFTPTLASLLNAAESFLCQAHQSPPQTRRFPIRQRPQGRHQLPNCCAGGFSGFRLN
jgi:transposase